MAIPITVPSPSPNKSIEDIDNFASVVSSNDKPFFPDNFLKVSKLKAVMQGTSGYIAVPRGTPYLSLGVEFQKSVWKIRLKENRNP